MNSMSQLPKTNSTFLHFVVMLIILLLPSKLLALSPEFEADRLMLLAEEQVNAQQFAKAEATLQQIGELKVNPPTQYYFLRGQVLSHNNRVTDAIAALETYVESGGKESDHYSQALTMISELKEKSPTENNSDNYLPGKAEINWAIAPQKNDGYLDHLQYLYQTKDTKLALVNHINTILMSYSISDGRRDGNTTQSGMRYSVATGNQGKLVTTTRDTEQQAERITNDQLSVYGVNPYVEYSCQTAANICVIYNPVNQQPWLQIVKNESAVKELSKAISELIKLMQTGAG